MNIIKILMLEDDVEDADIIKDHLKKAGLKFETTLASTKKDYIKELENRSFDVILCDHYLHKFNSADAIKIRNNKNLSTPFLLVSGAVSDTAAVNIIKEGASDYILKDRLQRLPAAITQAIEKEENRKQKIKAEQELIKSNERLKLVIKATSDAIWDWDMISNELIWGEGFETLFGYNLSTIKPSIDSWLIHIHPDDKERVVNSIYSIINSNDKTTWTCIYRYIRANGTYADVADKGLLLREEATNKPYRMVGAMRDISSQKELEEKVERGDKIIEKLLSAHDERFQLALNSSSDVLWEWDLVTNKLSLSEAYEKQFGHKITGNMTLEKDWLRHIYPDDKEAAERYFLKTLKSAETKLEYSHRIIKADGSVADVISRGVIKRTSEGRAYLMIGSIQDISGKKKLRKEDITENEERLQFIFNSSSEVLFDLDLETSEVKISDGYQKNFGYKVSNNVITVADWLRRIHPDDREAALDDYYKVLASSDNECVFSYRFLRADGSAAHVISSGIIMRHNDGSPRRIIGSIKDITDKKLSELERGKITSELLRRNEELERFTYIVSHNLRSPVANIMGLAQALNDDSYAETLHKQFLAQLNLSVLKLDDVIRDLNYILQIKNTSDEVKETVSLTDIVNDIKSSLAPLIYEHKVSIETDFTAIDKFVTVKTYLHNVLYNLISNSIKFRRPGLAPVISLKSFPTINGIELVASDNGLGIDLNKNKSEVFGLYKRFHPDIEGKGLGLFLAKTEIEKLGGTVEVKSDVNEGTTLKIFLPSINF